MDEISRSIGELHGKVDQMLVNQQALSSNVNGLNDRVNKVERDVAINSAKVGTFFGIVSAVFVESVKDKFF